MKGTKTKMFDIAVIGGGVVGALVARTLSKYDVKLAIIEKESDVAMGQSKANSGIVHAGYDPKPGTLKAKLNVRGAEMMEEVCRQLDVKFRRNGALVAGFDDEDMKQLEVLLDRGRKNGVEGLEILTGTEAGKLEKNLSERIKGALYVPTSAIVCPYELTIHAAGCAMNNGAELLTEFEVSRMERSGEGGSAGCSGSTGGFYRIYAADGRSMDARYVVNCAGIFSDEVAAMAGDCSFKVTGRKGEYLLLDKEAGDLVDMTVFRVPSAAGKGVLAIKTVDGNILLGPTSYDCEEKDDTAITPAGLDFVTKKEYEFFDEVPFDKVITQFTGVRAHGNTGDFIINSPAEGFINAAGIESPGLSSSPAIAEMIENMLLEKGALDGGLKAEYSLDFRGPLRFSELTMDEKNAVIAENPAFGRVICRCEEITEGEIIQAVRMNPPAKDVDGVKRRTRAGMGRCQGGFCMPQVAEIISRERNIPFEEVTKKGGKSRITFDRIKKGGSL